MALPKLVSLAEACRALSCSRWQFYSSPGCFPAPIKVGGRIKFREDELVAKIAELQAQTAASR